MTAPDPFTDEVRRLLAQDAGTLTDSNAPYDAIVRVGRAGQRRRQAAMGLGAAVLIAAPATAVATGWNTGPSDDGGFAPAASPSTTRTAPSKSATSRSTGVLQPPGSPDQLRDGLTMKQASMSLSKCFAQGHTQIPQKAGDYRLLLAWRIDANPNEGGTGIGVIGVSVKDPKQSVYCRDRDETDNVRVMNGDGTPERPVTVDANSNVLYRQIVAGGGPWDLPFRWAQFGTVDRRIARVTVTYGAQTVPAIIDRGYFVATGTLRTQTTKAPVVKGYDAAGTLIYDSTKDQFYDQLV
jgi:hypothetical protein